MAIEPVPAQLIQEAANKVSVLADATPGTAEAKTAANDILTLLIKIGQDIHGSGLLPALWMKWLAIGIAILGAIAGGVAGGRVSAPPDPVVAEVKVGTEERGKRILDKLDAILDKIDARQVIYAMPVGADVTILNSRPAGVVEVHPAGSGYRFNGSVIPMPVQITRDAAGNDLDVKSLR